MNHHDDAQPAWVLHTRPYRETSLLVDALTLNQGRVGFVARGVRGARAQPLRASLQPLQALIIVLKGRGELPTLVSAEVNDRAVSLSGRALLSAFYINELMTVLLPRHEPCPDLFWRYAMCLNALASGAAPAWQLRVFERDLLQTLGYAMRLDTDAVSAAAIDPSSSYRYDPERGAIPVRSGSPEAVSGVALLALAQTDPPTLGVQSELRHLMRRMIRWQLDGRELRSWRILAEIEGSRSISAAVRPAQAEVELPDVGSAND